MRDREEHLSARDAEVIDALYERDRDDDAPDGELAELQRLRSVFAELKAHQEEPPPAGMALLMAAARQAAEQRRPSGLWARLRSGWMAMAAHPAMSAVAAAVVVVGAAGYLLTRGVDSAVEATSPSAVEATTVSPRASDGAASAPRPAKEASIVAEPAKPAEAAALEPAPAAEQKNRAAAPVPQQEDEELEPPAGKRDRAPAPTKLAKPAKAKSDDRRLDKDAQSGDDAAGSLWGGGGAALQDAPAGPAAQSVVYPPPAAPPPPPAAPPPPPAAKTEVTTRAPASSPVAKSPGAAPAPVDAAGAERGSDDGDVKGTGAQRGVARSVERWYSLARSAATRGDCEEVRALGERIRSEDRAFYDSRFRKDQTILKCL